MKRDITIRDIPPTNRVASYVMLLSFGWSKTKFKICSDIIEDISYSVFTDLRV